MFSLEFVVKINKIKFFINKKLNLLDKKETFYLIRTNECLMQDRQTNSKAKPYHAVEFIERKERLF